jgi:sugar porter (SP) family MFS transporter
MESSRTQWLIPFGVQIIPAGLMAIALIFIKESPRWLMTRGRRDEGVKNLCWIRNLEADDIYMVEEVSAIDEAIEEQRSTVGLGFWQPFQALGREKSVQWRFFLGIMLFFWQNTSGINAINYYSPTVFKSIGVTGTNTGLLSTGIFGVVKTVFTLIWLFFLIDKFGRRRLLFVGAIGGSLCLWYVGAYIKVADPVNHPTTDGSISPGGISAMFFFYLWTAFYTPSWNGTPWVYNSEIFPLHVRTLGQALAAASNWLWNFLVSRFTPQMFTAMGYGVYFFFAALMLCSVVFVYFLVPETKGIPLESMDRLFSKDHKPKDGHDIVMRELQDEELKFRENVEGTGLQMDKEKNEVFESESPV